ncbi:hypothetical protein [Paenibacillus kribbensis]|uniref:hypothetical protein n=1 Tax=Paenibacillus kribbensis TaxID=172713 RepID=UPI001C4B8E5B|nr:hypothetical protein [Paenibacillus kribbensis]
MMAIDKARNISVFRISKNEVALPVNNAGSTANSLIQVLGISTAIGIEASKTKVDTNNTIKPRTIYRSGSGTNVNLTPRTVDTSGLSYFLKVVGDKGTLTTVEAVNATGVLKAVIDNAATGHVSVSAVDPYEHKMWIASREKANQSPYYLTEILKSISIKY